MLFTYFRLLQLFHSVFAYHIHVFFYQPNPPSRFTLFNLAKQRTRLCIYVCTWVYTSNCKNTHKHIKWDNFLSYIPAKVQNDVRILFFVRQKLTLAKIEATKSIYKCLLWHLEQLVPLLTICSFVSANRCRFKLVKNKVLLRGKNCYRIPKNCKCNK